MPRRDETTLDPAIERELNAIEAALAGEPTDAELAGLVRALRAERPTVREDFARRLDQRVQAGFARPQEERRSRPLRLVRAARSRASRRMLIPVLGAAASLLLVAGIATSVLLDGGGTDGVMSGPLPGSPQSERAVGAGQEEPSVAAPTTVPPVPPSDGPTVPGRRDRKVERQAELTLEASAGEVGRVADDVIRVTDRVGGIVVTSFVQSGDEGRAGASFQLRVPTDRLRQALAEYSKLAHVRSRTENAQDVTGSYTTAQERLGEVVAERRGLLRQLAAADTPNETESVRARLRIANGQISALRGQIARLRERTDYSVVTLIVEPRTGASGTGDGDDGWTPGDAFDDAVRILEVIAGVALIVLALVLPFALAAGGLALALRALRRRRREQALEAS